MRNSTSYGLAHTRTFRRSSKMLLGRRGSNLQNIEKSMREVYEPDGYTPALKEKCTYWLKCGDISVFTEEELVTLKVMIQVDQSGAEALIVAYECYAADYRQLFIHGVKPHVYMALKLFKEIWADKAKQYSLAITNEDIGNLYNAEIPNLKSHPAWKDLDFLIKESDGWDLTERFYYLAKQTTHSANYGIEWATFIMNILEKSGGKIVLSREEGEYFLHVYRALFPEIVDRCDRIKKQAEMHKMLFNLHGHPYQITHYEILTSHLKELYAWSAQSTVAEITRIAFSRLQEHVDSQGKEWDILNDCHDSFLVQAKLLDVKECSQTMKSMMNQKLVSPFDGTEFRMKSDCKVGFNWGDKKVVKAEDGNEQIINPEGLQSLSWI